MTNRGKCVLRSCCNVYEDMLAAYNRILLKYTVVGKCFSRVCSANLTVNYMEDDSTTLDRIHLATDYLHVMNSTIMTLNQQDSPDRAISSGWQRYFDALLDRTVPESARPWLARHAQLFVEQLTKMRSVLTFHTRNTHTRMSYVRIVSFYANIALHGHAECHPVQSHKRRFLWSTGLTG